MIASVASHFQRIERIPLEDVDVTGCMYHGNFLKYYDRARTDYLSSLGFSHAHMIETGNFFVVKAVTQDFIRPVLLETQVAVTLKIKKIGKASLTFFHAFQDNEGLLATATVVMVFVSSFFKPLVLPFDLKQKLTAETLRI